MRLLFLCSSLEPGRDGVGDYTRRLAEECLRLGHACAAVALNDPFVAESIEQTEPGGLLSLRLPPGADIASAVALRERFAPDWVSLQLVGYGLHPRGMLFEATPRLRRIIGPARLHLMLHELWLGNDASPSLRHRVIGRLQKTSLRRLIVRLRPDLVATTNPFYAALLETIGVRAEIEPLFGNIPVGLSKPLPVEIASRHRPGETWLGVFFGGLYRAWKPEPFLGRLERAARRAGRRVVLVQLGHPGAEGAAVWEEMERTYSQHFTFLRLGPQTAATISSVLQAADFGIAASPWLLIGKSGSAAVMLEHGLPVIVTRDNFQPLLRSRLPPTTDPLVFRDNEALEDALAAGLPKRAPGSRAPAFAAAWTARLAEGARDAT